jgi:2-hydroxychromene-2-carboxylate isomerase
MQPRKTMSAPIDFYFDFSSPYGYFGAMRIEALAQQYGRAVHWHPMLLGVVFKTTGVQPLPQVPIKGAYALRDFERTARLHKIAYRTPDTFPIPTQLAARAMLWIEQEEGATKASEFAKAAYRAYFAEGRAITDPDVIAAIAVSVGVDGAAVVDGAASAQIKERLKLQVEAALARGVFGSPFVIVDGEPFWGFDRFDQIEAWLEDGAF